MNYRYQLIFIFSTLILALSSLFGCTDDKGPIHVLWKDDEPKASAPKIEGSFIQDWLIYSWNDERWDSEFDILRQAGIKFLVLAPTMQGNNKEEYTTIFPSDLSFATAKYGTDLVDKCLFYAKKYDIKVFLGLNMHEDWWEAADMDPAWLTKQMKYGNMLAKNLVDKYKSKYPDSFYGWYWVWEIDNVKWNNQYAHKRLVNAMNINLNYLKKFTPDMPFMISPFFRDNVGTSKANEAMWEYILNNANFEPGDIFAPQDGVGAGSVKMENLAQWFKMLKKIANKKNGLRFWANTEIFVQYENEFVPATLDRVVEQMTIVYPLVDRIISFAYTHYYSPFQASSAFHEEYLQYLASGNISFNLPIMPVSNVRIEETTTIKLIWNFPENEDNIVGYRVFKDNILIAETSYDGSGNCRNFATIQKGSTGTYSVRSYNVVGQMSEKSEIIY